MKRINKRFFSIIASAAITLNMTAVCNIDNFTVNAGQQLGQTDFENGVGLPWHICESGPGKMDFEIDKGVYTVTIVNPGGASAGGEDRWDCQFRHRGLKIVAGHQYKVEYEITASNSGKYYTKIGNLDGDVEIWHNMSTNEGDFGANWDPMPINANETKKVQLTFTASQSLDVAEWAFHLGGDGQYTQGGCFPAGTVITFDNMSLTDMTSDENDYKAVEQWNRAEILTNQVSYFTDRAKKATMLCNEKNGISFDVKDSSDKTVYSGKSEAFGYDADSDDNVHIIDFSELNEEGTFYIEAENGVVSRKFKIGDDEIYSSLLYDSLNYFYQNRSGIEIESQYITSGDSATLARAAGHTSDNAEVEQTWGYSGSSGSQEVSGGWYDAGDHGKYVVNGGIALWIMQNQYETAKLMGFEDAFADGTMNIPENSNCFPDLLDEARWEMEWMMKMLVNGGEYDGMVYHKVHDEKWTALALAPADDDLKRILKPPTTAATLNVSACAAQAARLWKGIDDDFSDKCLEIAEKTYEAAKKHPDMYAPLDESIGGGAYGDNNAEDELYWAASELYITTGDDNYYNDMKNSDYFLKLETVVSDGEHVDTPISFDWGNTASLGTLALAVNKDAVDSSDYDKVILNITKAADYYVELEDEQGYGLPYGQSTVGYNDSSEGYIWGSNSAVADNAVVIAYAYMLSDDDKYMNGVISAMDYLLGRNPMDYSYVTGYGTHTAEYPHHRWWSNQIDELFPKAPCGVLVGGPNSGMQDPWVKGSGWKHGEIAPQKCYLDHVEAWSVNECTINWNAPLAWLTGFVTAENGGITIGSTGTGSNISNDGGKGESNKNETYDEDKVEKTTKKNSSNKNSDDKDDKDDKSEKSEKSEKSNLKLFVIAGAIVIGLISVEIFAFKLIKMLKGNNSSNSNDNK